MLTVHRYHGWRRIGCSFHGRYFSLGRDSLQVAINGRRQVPAKSIIYLWYGWLSVIMYCLHQSEEHAYDIRGWRYSFVPSLNFGPISDMYGDEVFVDPKMTLYINTVAIWIGFGGCMMFASLSRDNRYLLCGYLNWGTAIVNGICGHFIPAILTITYNPGVVQSSIMVPLGIFIIRKSGHTMLCIANGIIFHAALIASVNVIFRFHTPETTTTIAFNLVAGLVLPLVISKYVVAPQSNKNRHE